MVHVIIITDSGSYVDWSNPFVIIISQIISNQNFGQHFMIVWLQFLADDTLSEAGDFDFYLSSYVRQDITDKVSK